MCFFFSYGKRRDSRRPAISIFRLSLVPPALNYFFSFPSRVLSSLANYGSKKRPRLRYWTIITCPKSGIYFSKRRSLPFPASKSPAVAQKGSKKEGAFFPRSLFSFHLWPFSSFFLLPPLFLPRNVVKVGYGCRGKEEEEEEDIMQWSIFAKVGGGTREER